MSISNQIKEVLKHNKSQIELLQLAMVSSIAGLVYSEFIRNFKQVFRPVRKIFIPEIEQVQDFLNPENEFITYISNNIIDEIMCSKLFQEFSYLDDLVLFQEKNIELLKTIVDLYILPNITKTIPNVITTKFGLDNLDNQLFIQSNEIDLFHRKPLNESYMRYIVDQIILQMFTIIPGIEKTTKLIESNADIVMVQDNKSIMSISNDNAISIIHFNKQIFENSEVMDVLSFVTSTTISLNIDTYSIKTNPYNQVILTEIHAPH